jgi:hypothetical protein
MLRWMIPCCVMFGCALLAATEVRAADQSAARPTVQRAARQLPPGLPRAHYKARTTPLLLGSQTLPGYYGRAFDYNYQGAYYGGGGYVPYLFREPYACGVTGYC